MTRLYFLLPACALQLDEFELNVAVARKEVVDTILLDSSDPAIVARSGRRGRQQQQQQNPRSDGGRDGVVAASGKDGGAGAGSGRGSGARQGGEEEAAGRPQTLEELWAEEDRKFAENRLPWQVRVCVEGVMSIGCNGR